MCQHKPSGGQSGKSEGNKPAPGNTSSPAESDPTSRAKRALDRNGETTASREQTPDGQKPGEGSPKEKAGEKPGDGKKPASADGGDPNSPLASKAEPRKAASAPPAKSATGAGSTADATDRWGDLPVYARDVFRAQGGDALPMRYRDFIDGYYRRLNEPR